MPVLSILNQTAGPLPISTTFNAPSDGPACFALSGSVWSTTANEMLGVAVQLDGVTIGSASIFSNASSTHRATVPSYIPVTLTFGPHKITLLPLNSSTISDLNDLFDLVLLY
jgi:hypothetical protein